MKNQQENTRLIHNGHWKDDPIGASSLPIYRASTYNQDPREDSVPYDYVRSGNPTRAALEEAIADLENGQYGFAFASGIAAISSALMLVKSGDHIIVGEDIYGGTYRVLTAILERWGLQTSWVDAADLAAVEAAISPETAGILVESPSNPLMRICDMIAIAELAKKHNLLSLTDNTFMTPLLQKPLDLGFDIVLHSATKFLGGHSDVLAGLAVVSDSALATRLRQVQIGFGAVLSPDDSWLVLRGMRTLGVRLAAQQQSASALAEWLQKQKRISQVYYPGLANHLHRSMHERQSSGSGAVLSFELENRTAALDFMAKVQIPLTAVSLGGVESIVSHPATMSHAAMPPEERKSRGINDGLLRLSVGLESVDDLITDFSQALS